MNRSPAPFRSLGVFLRPFVRRFSVVAAATMALLLVALPLSAKNKTGSPAPKASPRVGVVLSGAPFEAVGNIAVTFEGDAPAVQALSLGQAQPLSLASADLNGDG